MQVWLGVLAAGAVAGATLLVGPPLASWASGRAVRLPVATTAVTAGLSGFAVGAGLGWTPALAAYAVLAVGSSLLVGTDLALHRLPDRLTAGLAGSGVVLLAAASVAGAGWAALGRAAVGGAVLLGAYLLLFVAVGTGLGAGDVKLAGVLGLHLAWPGWPTLVLGALAGVLAGGLVSAVLLGARRATMTTRVPFGPSMLAGAFLAIAIGDPAAAAVLGWDPA